MIATKLHDKYLFNFLTGDRQNAEAVMEAGNGSVVPGIVASDYATAEEGALKIADVKQVSEVASVGLGGGGDPSNWEKALEIAKISKAGHLNQPYHKSVHSRALLQEDGYDQLVNGLIIPTGEKGYVRVPASEKLYPTEFIIEMAAMHEIESIKLMPVKGLHHLEALVEVTRIAAANDIRGVEPAGGIDAGNIRAICEAVSSIEIEFFMPHIFGAVLDGSKQFTIPEKVREIMKEMEG